MLSVAIRAAPQEEAGTSRDQEVLRLQTHEQLSPSWAAAPVAAQALAEIPKRQLAQDLRRRLGSPELYAIYACSDRIHAYTHTLSPKHVFLYAYIYIYV